MSDFREHFGNAINKLVLAAFVVAMLSGTTYVLTQGQTDLAFLTPIAGIAMAIGLELGSFAAQAAFHIAQHRLDVCNNPQVEDVYLRQRNWAFVNTVLFAMIQIGSGIAYRAIVWHALSVWLIIAYGLLPPLVFFFYGFLERQITEPDDIRADAQKKTAIMAAKHGRHTAVLAVQLANRTMRQRVKKVAKSGADMTGLAVGMQRRLGDNDGAHTTMTIDHHLREIEGLEPRDYAAVWQSPDNRGTIQLVEQQESVTDMHEVPQEKWEQAKFYMRGRTSGGRISINIAEFAREIGVAQATASKIFARYCEDNNITEKIVPAVVRRNRGNVENV